MSAEREPDAKVLFRVEDPDPDSDEAFVETLWAYSLGDDLYELNNIPFYPYGVSCGDIVRAPYNDCEEFPTFEAVERKSGNRTVRVNLEPAAEPGNVSDRLMQGLVALGCDFEGGYGVCMAVNIPPEVPLEAWPTTGCFGAPDPFPVWRTAIAPARVADGLAAIPAAKAAGGRSAGLRSA